MSEPDWYCNEVIPGKIADLEVLLETPEVLAFRPPRPGFGTDHVIVIPKRHVRSLLELDPGEAPNLLDAIQVMAERLIELHGTCQVFTNVGAEQHNKHLHFHLAVGDGVARFVN